MIPIHALLSRIRWDAAFARSRFVIGYWDRVVGKVLLADLREITWDADNPAFFDLMDEEGVAHSIPFHRVREVWRDGKLIWQRHLPDEPPAYTSMNEVGRKPRPWLNAWHSCPLQLYTVVHWSERLKPPGKSSPQPGEAPSPYLKKSLLI